MLELPQIRSLIKTLNEGDEAARWEALRDVKQNGSQEWAALPNDVVQPLVRALCEQLPRTNGASGRGRVPTLRQEVVVLLGNIGARSGVAVNKLMDLLGDDESQAVREAAVTALGKIGSESKPAIDKLVTFLVPGCRDTLVARIALALGDIGRVSPKVKAALVNLWLTPGFSENCREQIALALCKLSIDAPGLPAYLTKVLLANSALSSRKAAAEALGYCNKANVGVVPALVVALYDVEEDVQRLATTGLDRMHLTREKAVAKCGEQLADCTHAETALRKAGALALPTLTEALAHEDWPVRQKAAQILGSLGEAAAAAAPSLSAALEDETPEVRLCAAKALWNITKQPDGVVATLAGLLKGTKGPTDDPEARRQFVQSVIEALGRIGPPAKATIPALVQRAKDENRLIRESAQRTLRQIDPTRT